MIRLGTAMTSSAPSRSSQLAGREILKPCLSTRTALARLRMPLGLRGQAVCLGCLLLIGIDFPPRRFGRRGAHGPVPTNRLRAQERLNVDDLTWLQGHWPQGLACRARGGAGPARQPAHGGLAGGLIPRTRRVLEVRRCVAE